MKRVATALWVLLALVGVLAMPACGKKATSASQGAEEGASVAQEVSAATDDAADADDEASESADTSTKSGSSTAGDETDDDDAAAIDEDGTYTSKEDVALYLHTYGHLPDNYVTKEEAEDAGWKTEGLTVDEACPGKSIGGSYFGNYEGRLPSAKGRKWSECDIDYNGGKSRGAKRLVYSNDGLIYYTEDHYETFEQLY